MGSSARRLTADNGSNGDTDLHQGAFDRALWEDHGRFPRSPQPLANLLPGHFFHTPQASALIGLGPWRRAHPGELPCEARACPSETSAREEWVVTASDPACSRSSSRRTREVWGRPAASRADWEAQRIKTLDLVAAVRNAMLGSRADAKSSPRSSNSSTTRGGSRNAVGAVEREGRGTGAESACIGVYRMVPGTATCSRARREEPKGRPSAWSGALLSTMPVRELGRALSPRHPARLQAAERLGSRLSTVVLIIDGGARFPQWIYIQSPEVRVFRTPEFSKNWSVMNGADVSLEEFARTEYFVHEGRAVRFRGGARRARERETARLGLVKAGRRRDAVVRGESVSCLRRRLQRGAGPIPLARSRTNSTGGPQRAASLQPQDNSR